MWKFRVDNDYGDVNDGFSDYGEEGEGVGIHKGEDNDDVDNDENDNYYNNDEYRHYRYHLYRT